jgi:hypothetical protein
VDGIGGWPAPDPDSHRANLKLFCGTARDIAADRIEMWVNVEKAHYSLGLLIA